MHQRSERHVTHPWRLARQRAEQLDLPPGAEAPSGAARLALEAAFVEPQAPPSAVQAPAAGDGAPLEGTQALPAVVIKRKRTFAAPGARRRGEPRRGRAIARRSGGRPRATRVPGRSRFREDGHGAPEPAAAAPAGAPRSTERIEPRVDRRGADVAIGPVPEPAAATRRARRRAAPAVVTRFVTEPPDAGVDGRTAACAPDAAGELMSRLAALEAVFCSIRSARDFRAATPRETPQGHPAPGSYLALTAEIRRLRALAEAAREAEASDAIAWIRRAIETYGLRREDLGM